MAPREVFFSSALIIGWSGRRSADLFLARCRFFLSRSSPGAWRRRRRRANHGGHSPDIPGPARARPRFPSIPHSGAPDHGQLRKARENGCRLPLDVYRSPTSGRHLGTHRIGYRYRASVRLLSQPTFPTVVIYRSRFLCFVFPRRHILGARAALPSN